MKKVIVQTPVLLPPTLIKPHGFPVPIVVGVDAGSVVGVVGAKVPDTVLSSGRERERFRMAGLMMEKTRTGERTSTRPKMALYIFPLSSVMTLTASLWK